MVTPTAQNLIRVFFLREQMKKLAGSGNKIEHVHVIGAGAMGGDIAAWCASQDMRVTLADMKAEPIAGAIKRAADLFGKILRKRTDVRDALDRLMPDMGGEGVRNADLIIEAVPEKLELKQKVYAGLEPVMKPGAILATNVQHSLAGSAHHLQQPERLLGTTLLQSGVAAGSSRSSAMTAPMQQLTWRSRSPSSAPSTGCHCRSRARPVSSSRALTPYMLEAMVMLDEKIDKSMIDAAATNSACRSSRSNWPISRPRYLPRRRRHAAFKVRRRLPRPAWLRDKVATGELGRRPAKTSTPGATAKPINPSSSRRHDRTVSGDGSDRLIAAISNVYSPALREGIVDNADVVDGAMIFGTGYALVPRRS